MVPRTVPCQGIIWPQMSVVLRLRNPGPRYDIGWRCEVPHGSTVKKPQSVQTFFTNEHREKPGVSWIWSSKETTSRVAVVTGITSCFKLFWNLLSFPEIYVSTQDREMSRMRVWELASLHLYGGTNPCSPSRRQYCFWFTVLLRSRSSDPFHLPFPQHFSPLVTRGLANQSVGLANAKYVNSYRVFQDWGGNHRMDFGTHWFHYEMGPIQKFGDHLISLSSCSDWFIIVDFGSCGIIVSLETVWIFFPSTSSSA